MKKIELLAPGGDVDSIKAAIVAGANAIYCGLNKFNARNRAENITIDDLNGILRLAHKNSCEVFLTLNVIIVESEIPALIGLLNKLVNTKIDGVIVQDLGMFYLISKYFAGLKIHASTQLTTHNSGQIKFLNQLNATRVNLSRELSITEIKDLTVTAHENSLLTEVFVHGSYCISFSGICYFSSVHGGNSGNRGRCSQPCRDQYLTTATGKNFPLNLKDNSAFFDLRELSEAGVDSVKIEGRIKKFHYVYTVVNSWKKQLHSLCQNDKVGIDTSDLYTVFNRDFSNSFLQGDINRNMFIDNPRDNSAIHRALENGGSTSENIKQAKRELYDLKTEIIDNARSKIEKLNIAKAPLIITVSGKEGSPLKVSVQTPEKLFVVISDGNLVGAGHQQKNKFANSSKKRNATVLNYEAFFKRFKSFNDTEYFIKQMELDNLQSDLFIPFKELTTIKKRILFVLNGDKETAEPIAIPFLKKQPKINNKSTLSLLISSEKDLNLSNKTTADVYFQLPNSCKNRCSEFLDIFSKNNIVPWFPSVMIGDDYHAALEILHYVKAGPIVTNNSGIAYEAYRKGIPWVAGPYLNIVNSFSLLCLKKKFNATGAFLSNELSRGQIRGIKRPDDFKLFYRIYHPIVLLTSRQCLFHQVIGCKKSRIDESCIQQCEKYSSITNLKDASLFIEKTRGNYHSIYNEINFLNTDIVKDVPGQFSSFFIDLRDVKTDTKMDTDKSKVVQLFEEYLDGDLDSLKKLKKYIFPTINTSYEKGI